MKTAPTEKTEYTTTTATKNPTKLQSQKFDFWNFVTEIFRFKISHFFVFFQNLKNTILTNLATKFGDHPMHLDQSLKVENNPQVMLFKLGFIHFFRRTLSFGSILSYNLLSMSVSQENDFFLKKLWNKRFCFANISMNKASPEKMEYTATKPTKNSTR